ncbi:hypothetical protein [Myroides odoratus]|uniref:Uncharacterized protein n=1 Tax=Myroides odoratus TaxID=256 RepID=A0A9Q7E9H4_MYROD|nr:hypothetical protein [Myroides odoratus]EHQ43865.1 hypothetical protein Myrod_3046 [Myroides odoratus DSM 2801]EKB04863.1 hypothetical protein HMPREF9716_03051 [Myroides odoratus CIP 103059]QQU01172.1 hypothetical protein I6I88_05315 [Myroides odoratus]WQD56572.1 hypothetical protein U0010_13715 [Myroides odoratus]STZ31142.1 Uncharacterised protein [Myroides odoratus]
MHFAEQFLKDLQKATSLDQIKWIFDGKKNPSNFRKNMEKAIDKMTFDDDLLLKFGVDDIDELRYLIEINFDKIFKLTN